MENITKNNVVVFVYAKDNKIKVLGLEDAKNLNDTLKSVGWKHTETIDACAWMEYLHNMCEDVDVYESVISLSKPTPKPTPKPLPKLLANETTNTKVIENTFTKGIFEKTTYTNNYGYKTNR